MSGKKGGLSHYLYGTVKGKIIVNYMMSYGAAIVIVGALFKIQHYPGASMMLIIGLLTEAFLFAVGSIEPQHLSTDWSKVYPELAHHEEGDEEAGEDSHEVADVLLKGSNNDDELPITHQLDNLLEEAKIGPDLMESLGDGLRNLSSQAKNISDISDASVATNENVRNASTKVGELSSTYEKAASSLVSISESSTAGSEMGEHMGSISKNLGALNATYEMQLKEANTQLESSSQLFGGISGLMENLNASVEDSKKYRENIAELSENISQLNTVYGNMLTAMNTRG
jgi:gliding motility-associated protein GldL